MLLVGPLQFRKTVVVDKETLSIRAITEDVLGSCDRVMDSACTAAWTSERMN